MRLPWVDAQGFVKVKPNPDKPERIATKTPRHKQ
jgi:hypothetical protein